MARLFPFRSEPADNEGQPRIVDLEGEDADAVFGALSSTTARRIYARLDEEPGTPSDVAEAIDSSIQNVRYHLEKLENAGLVEVVDTWYSSRGNEMSVYATTDGPLIVTSDESAGDRLREALSRFVGGIGALAGGSLLVQFGLTRWAESAIDSSPGVATNDAAGDDASGDGDGSGGTDGADGDDAAEGETDDTYTGASADDVNEESADAADVGDTGDSTAGDAGDAGDGVEFDVTDANESADHVVDGGADIAATIFETVPPGALFFLGGLLVLIAVTLYWYWYRPAY